MSAAASAGAPDAPGTGSALREEAGQLVDVVLERLTAARGGLPQDAPPAAPPCPTCGHHAGAECGGCPWCAVRGLLRGERPELAATLLDGAIAVLQTLRGVVAPAAPAPPGADEAPSASTTSTRAADPAPRRTERIRIS